MDIFFYHLTRATLEQALPELLEKTLQRGWRAIIKTSSKERTESLAEHLWSARRDSFLPHGTEKDGFATEQPIWLTEHDENPNSADLLFVVDGAHLSMESLSKTPENTGVFANLTRVCIAFDGQNETALAHARSLWSSYKALGHNLAYWQQEAKGWTQKR